MALVAPEAGQTGQTDRSGLTEAQILFARFEGIGQFIDSYDPARYPAEGVAELLARFSEVERRVAAGKTLSAARLAEYQAHLRTGHRTPAEFLSAATGESIGDSLGLIRLGESLHRQPHLDEAFRGGKLSRSRAALVAEAAKVNPNKEHDLVAGAEQDTFASLKERCLRAKAQGLTREEGPGAEPGRGNMALAGNYPTM